MEEATSQGRRRSRSWSDESQIFATKKRPRCSKKEATTKDFQPFGLLSSLTTELLYQVSAFLSAKSKLALRQTNQRFNELLLHDLAGWEATCQRLWRQKVHVISYSQNQIVEDRLLHSTTGSITATSCTAISNAPAADTARKEKSSSFWYQSYLLSCIDSRRRQEILLHELVYSNATTPSTTVWSFRFKKNAPSNLLEGDPWHNDEKARQLAFRSNGTVGQVLHDTLLPTAFAAPLDPTVDTTVRWRRVQQPLDSTTRARPLGAYFRLTIHGQDLPTFHVRRSPTGNWGFVLENCWAVATSFPMQTKPEMKSRTATTGDTADAAAAADDEEEELLAVSESGTSFPLKVMPGQQSMEVFLYHRGFAHLPDNHPS